MVSKSGKEVKLKKLGNLGTACIVFNRKLHSMIGFFCMEYEKYGEEDPDLCARARIAGYEMGYIKQNGNHFGQGELDQGEYRAFKDACRSKNIAKFRENCYAYASGRKPIYISYP